MLDQNGYIKLIDFGLAKLIGHESTSLCGTAEYMAPEMVSEVGHHFAVDWWATGILLYEMLIGITPFFDKNRYTLFENVKNKRPRFPDKNRYGIEYSDEFVDLIGRLLEKDPQKRLGSKNDYQEILSHPWFEGVDHQKLLDQTIPSPCKPNSDGEPN